MNANGKEFLPHFAKLLECDTSSCRFPIQCGDKRSRPEDAPHSESTSCESIFRLV
jgi:hypothetical protein